MTETKSRTSVPEGAEACSSDQVIEVSPEKTRKPKRKGEDSTKEDSTTASSGNQHVKRPKPLAIQDKAEKRDHNGSHTGCSPEKKKLRFDDAKSSSDEDAEARLRV